MDSECFYNSVLKSLEDLEEQPEVNDLFTNPESQRYHLMSILVLLPGTWNSSVLCT